MRKIDLFTALSPFVATISYIILGLNGYWIEGWVVFMLIPMLGILNYPNKKVMLLWELLAIVGIVGYLYVGLTYENTWQYAWLSFVPFIAFSAIKNDWGDSERMPNDYRLVVLLSIAAFLLVGYFLSAWVVSWLFLLAIPVYAIVTEVGNKEKAVALSPFVALIIFMLVGYYGDLWHLSWIIFIIIPMTAIIKNA